MSWLNDEIISTAQSLLHNQTQCSKRSPRLIQGYASKYFVQILHVANYYHWGVASNIDSSQCHIDSIGYYDSGRPLFSIIIHVQQINNHNFNMMKMNKKKSFVNITFVIY